MNENYLPICTHCYAVRVEPQRAKAMRPTCAACGEEIAKQVKHTIVPMNKSIHKTIDHPLVFFVPFTNNINL
jgi:PHP family Zn ribbon phosphoesterase